MLSTKHALTATVWRTDSTATQLTIILALTLVQEGGPTLVLDMDQLQGMVVHLAMMLTVVEGLEGGGQGLVGWVASGVELQQGVFLATCLEPEIPDMEATIEATGLVTVGEDGEVEVDGGLLEEEVVEVWQQQAQEQELPLGLEGLGGGELM